METRAKRSCPGGAQERSSTSHPRRRLVHPATRARRALRCRCLCRCAGGGAGESSQLGFHGLRCGREDAGGLCAVRRTAPPVATALRPFGACSRPLRAPSSPFEVCSRPLRACVIHGGAGRVNPAGGERSPAGCWWHSAMQLGSSASGLRVSAGDWEESAGCWWVSRSGGAGSAESLRASKVGVLLGRWCFHEHCA